MTADKCACVFALVVDDSREKVHEGLKKVGLQANLRGVVFFFRGSYTFSANDLKSESARSQTFVLLEPE